MNFNRLLQRFSISSIVFRLQSTTSTRSRLLYEPNTVVGKILQKWGYGEPLQHSKKVLAMSGRRLYVCCAEMVDYDNFFKEMRLEDTFNAWFRVLTLHTWMLFVRLGQEGATGRYIRSRVLLDLWHDIDLRLSKLGPMRSKVKLQGQRDMVGQLQFAFVAYDEGLMSHDRVLAGALWRAFFESRIADPILLEQMVHYVRKQVHYLDSQQTDVLLKEGIVTFLPLFGDQLNVERTQAVKDMLNFRIGY